MPPRRIQPFLMFQRGGGSEALAFYQEVFPDTVVGPIERYGQEEAGPEGTIKRGSLTVAGQTIQISDSFVTHAFDFTPSFSFFIDCDVEADVDALATALSQGSGTVLMPAGDYGFSKRFAWVNDRFGVSWQVNCP
jgi:predicted 3-demethylubiquinone-9 3-methyltransferase (glyoxalase superfamily)